VPKQYYDAMDPFVVLAAASQVTTRIKFGTGVALIQQRDVIQTAKHGSLVLIASYAQLGRDEEVKNALADMSALPAGGEKTTRWYLDRYSDPATREHVADGLRKAGLLEQ
jgi:hypothetical protein